MARRTALLALLTIVALAAVWGAFRVLPRWLHSGAETAPSLATPATPTTPAAAERKIKATLYYVAEDGMSMAAAEREIPFAEPVAAQARSIIEAQLAEAPAPLASAIPAGATLRSVFVTERGDAFVDLSADVTAKHPGGVLEELFTVYAIVNALTVNLPAIVRVQILVNGHEADTLAGHLDLRRPLQKNLSWLAVPAGARPDAP